VAALLLFDRSTGSAAPSRRTQKPASFESAPSDTVPPKLRPVTDPPANAAQLRASGIEVQRRLRGRCRIWGVRIFFAPTGAIRTRESRHAGRPPRWRVRPSASSSDQRTSYRIGLLGSSRSSRCLTPPTSRAMSWGCRGCARTRTRSAPPLCPSEMSLRTSQQQGHTIRTGCWLEASPKMLFGELGTLEKWRFAGSSAKRPRKRPRTSLNVPATTDSRSPSARCLAPRTDERPARSRCSTVGGFSRAASWPAGARRAMVRRISLNLPRL
jgi:hypothetical protein